MKKNILLFGAGKSATVLIEYLIGNAVAENWQITIADFDKNNIMVKTGNHVNTMAIQMDIEKDKEARTRVIAAADIVISLLPPHLHILVAKDCIQLQKNLLTASYLDEAIKTLEKEIGDQNLLFLYEMGLDPGIDHMSAMQLIHEIKEKNGSIISFKSHCGGLVAPESDNNPWHYKISWNPRNVVMAGKAGAEFLFENKKVTLSYKDLFKDPKMLDVEGLSSLSYYPNRDSISYIPVYQLEGVKTFLRTTIRHLDFMVGWNKIIQLNFTDENKIYDTNGKSLGELFKEHLAKQDNKEWLSQSKENGPDALPLKLLVFLGLNDTTTKVNKGICSAADILQFALEQKLILNPEDKDMIVMQHEIEYVVEGHVKKRTSTLIVKGADGVRTGMAKTVGLPLGIAAKLILNGKITIKGLRIPIHKTIYQPVLEALKGEDIRFRETENIIV